MGFAEGSGDFYWSSDDQIGVVLSSAPEVLVPMDLKEGAGTPSGKFECSGIGELQQYAVYPYSTKHKLNSNQLTYHIDETADISSFDENIKNTTLEEKISLHSTDAPMWGAVKNGHAYFSHLGGVLYLQLPVLPAGDSFTIEVSADQRLSGDFVVDLPAPEQSEKPAITTDSNPSGHILTRRVSNAQHSTKGVFYFPLPTGNLTNLRLVVKDATGDIFSNRVYHKVTVKRQDLLLATGADKFEFDKKNIQLTDKEFRGVWLSTYSNFDWPSKSFYNNIDQQKESLKASFDVFKSLNINSVFFQIRASGDAFYDSEYESWSNIFTGVRGQHPGWEPIRFAIDEAHKRGMQIHFWINPYRIATRKDASISFPDLDPKIPIELVKDYNGIRMYNPGLPEVRDRIVAIVDEVLTKYPDADGIHFDDYFYPAVGAWNPNQDDAEEYEKYHKAGQTIDEWRFDNVNQMVKMVHDKVKEKNPNLPFTISPQGNTDNNKRIYADIPTWCTNQWIDAIIPQLYWDHSYFDDRLKEFCGYAAGKVSVIVGYAMNKFYGDDNGNYSGKGNEQFNNVQLFKEEHDLATGYPQVLGDSHYRASHLTGIGLDKVINNALRNKVKEVYTPYRLAPYMGTTHDKISTPTGIKVSPSMILTWESVPEATQYAIYKDSGVGLNRGHAAELIGVVRGKELSFQLPDSGTYYLTALDRYNQESEVSDMICVRNIDSVVSDLEKGHIVVID